MSFELSRTRLGKKFLYTTIAALTLVGCGSKADTNEPVTTLPPRAEGAYKFVLGCSGETNLQNITSPTQELGATAVFSCSDPDGFEWSAFTGVPSNFEGSPEIDPEVVKEGAKIYVAVTEAPQTELPNVVNNGQTLSVEFNDTMDRIYVNSLG